MGAANGRVRGARVALVRRLLLLAGVLAFLPLGAACGGLNRSNSLPEMTGAPEGMDDSSVGGAAWKWVGQQILGAVIGKATGLGCDWLIKMAGLSPDSDSGAQLDAITAQLDRLQSSVNGLHDKLDENRNKLDTLLLIEHNEDYQAALKSIKAGWINYRNAMATVEAFQKGKAGATYDRAQKALNDWADACNILGAHHPLSTVMCTLDAMLMSSSEFGEPRIREWGDKALLHLKGDWLVPSDEALGAEYFVMAGLFLYVVERERQACQMLEEALKLDFGRPSSRQAADAGAVGSTRASVGDRPAMAQYPGAPTEWLKARLGEQASEFLQQVERLAISTANYRTRLDNPAADPPFLREIATCDKGILWHAHYIAGQVAPERFDTATMRDGQVTPFSPGAVCFEVIGECWWVERFTRDVAPGQGLQVVRFGGADDQADVRYYDANLCGDEKAYLLFRGTGGNPDPNRRDEVYAANRVAAAMFRMPFGGNPPPVSYLTGDPGLSVNAVRVPWRYYNYLGEEGKGNWSDQGERCFGSATAMLRSTPKLYRTTYQVYYRTEVYSEIEANGLPVTTNDDRVWQYKDWERIPGHGNTTAVTQVSVHRADLFSGYFGSQRGSGYAELIQYWTVRDVVTTTDMDWYGSGMPDITSSDLQFDLTLKVHLDHTVTLYDGVATGNASKHNGGYTNQIKGTLVLESPGWLRVFTTVTTVGPLESRVDRTEAKSAEKYLELTRHVGSAHQSLGVRLWASLKIRNLAGDMFWRRCGYEWAPRYVILELTPS